mmetsp:Transcript_106938/g.319765  ORF Transcript_106938/g.319765 Transcript_106938/m.319765 type:complete len:204 (+) Transcript_106938:1140-1751(+)
MKTLNSFARFVGEAGCPWVLASIGTSHSGNFPLSVSRSPSRLGINPFSSASFKSRGDDVLLTSWLVSAKCTYSLKGCRPRASNCSLMKYSTALTSWLVIFSVALILPASSRLKLDATARSFGTPSAGKSLPAGSFSMRARKYSISTCTRYLMRPYSEKYCARDLVLRRYRPSTGETAVSSVRSRSPSPAGVPISGDAGGPAQE